MGVAVQTHVPDRVRELRAAGYSPKQIAKTLDLRPAVVARLVRMLSAEQAAAAPEPAVVGCWVSPGWSAHLTVDGPAEWADVPPPEDGRGRSGRRGGGGSASTRARSSKSVGA